MASKWKGGGAGSFAWLSQLLAPTVTQALWGQGRLPVYLVWKDVPIWAIVGEWGIPEVPQSLGALATPALGSWAVLFQVLKLHFIGLAQRWGGVGWGVCITCMLRVGPDLCLRDIASLGVPATGPLGYRAWGGGGVVT